MARKRFEYLREAVQPQDLQRRLSALGKDGWDLVTVLHSGDALIAVLKREAE